MRTDSDRVYKWRMGTETYYLSSGNRALLRLQAELEGGSRASLSQDAVCARLHGMQGLAGRISYELEKAGQPLSAAEVTARVAPQWPDMPRHRLAEVVGEALEAMLETQRGWGPVQVVGHKGAGVRLYGPRLSEEELLAHATAAEPG